MSHENSGKSDQDLMPPPNIQIEKSDVAEFPMMGGPQRAPVGNQRRKVMLQPGYSPMDWAALKTSGKDLTGGIIAMKRYTLDDLAKHNQESDLWMAYRGKVYNVTMYVNYHPGGIPQLCRGAGKDATALISRIHPWVNVELMLDRCMIGYLLTE